MKEWSRHAASVAVLGFFLALNTATSRPPPPPPPKTTTSTISDAAVVVTPHDAAGSADDIDVSAAQAAVGCPKAGDVCRILGEFSKGVRPSDLPSIGQDTWVGYTYSFDAPRAAYFIKIQRGYSPSPIPSLDPDVMEVSAVGKLVRPENAGDADAWIASSKSGAAAATGNRAAEFARTYSPTEYICMARTDGVSIAVLVDSAPPHVFIRASGSKLVMIEHAPGKTVSHDKVSSKLFATEMWKSK